MVFAINMLKFSRSSAEAVKIIEKLASAPNVFHLEPHSDRRAPIEPMDISTFFNVSFWNDLFGGKSAVLYIVASGGDAVGGVRLPLSTIGIPEFTIEAKGVREGAKDPSKPLHRWGEGGFYTGFTTHLAPAVVHWQGKYHVFHVTSDHGKIQHLVSENGMAWEKAAPDEIGFSASGAVCPLVVGGELVLFFRDGSGNGLLYVVWKNGKFERPPTPEGWYCGINIYGAPSAVLFRGEVIVVGQAANGKKVVGARYVSHTWQTFDLGCDTSRPPALIEFDGMLHLFYVDPTGNEIMHRVSSDGRTWRDASPLGIGFATSASPRPFAHHGRVYVLFRDGAVRANGLLAVRAPSGSTHFEKEPDWYIGLESDGAPSVAVVDNQVLVIARDGGGSGIMGIVPDLG